MYLKSRGVSECRQEKSAFERWVVQKNGAGNLFGWGHKDGRRWFVGGVREKGMDTVGVFCVGGKSIRAGVRGAHTKLV